MITLIRNENSPIVTKFKGNATILNIGFITTNISESDAPPMIKEIIPPDTFTPEKITVRIKREKA